MIEADVVHVTPSGEAPTKGNTTTVARIKVDGQVVAVRARRAGVIDDACKFTRTMADPSKLEEHDELAWVVEALLADSGEAREI